MAVQHTTTQDNERLERAARHARAIRGRVGSDVWQKWLDAPREWQEAYLKKIHGVTDDQAGPTRQAVTEILLREGGHIF